MQSLIYQVGPDDNHDFPEAEFAEAPGTVNVKCLPNHAEILWHTNVDIDNLFGIIDELSDDHSDVWNEVIQVEISGINWQRENIEIDSSDSVSKHTIPAPVFRDKFEDLSELNRCPLFHNKFLILWTREEEPPHPRVEVVNRDPLQYHIAIRSSYGKSDIKRISTLYERTGEPELTDSSRRKLIRDVGVFMKSPENCRKYNSAP